MNIDIKAASVTVKPSSPGAIELCCEDCGARVNDAGRLAGARICPQCGGRLVSARLHRARPA